MRCITADAQEFAIKLLEHLVVPVFVLDAAHRVIVWNHACEQLTGIKAADMVGSKNHWRAFYNVPRPCLVDLVVDRRLDEVASLYDDSDKVIELEYGVHATNWCAMPQRGKRLYLAIDVRPIYGADGEIVAAVETLRDMTVQLNLEHEAMHDGLTDLFNRRAFDSYLVREWTRSTWGRQSMALIMADIDHFKSYNDMYGHIKGDDCLRKVAAALQAAIRPRDVVVRYGGEEFIAILSDTTIEAAAVVAERIKTHIAALAIPHGSSEHGVVSASMGVAATVPCPGMDASMLLAAADAALYQAKHGGRNLFILASADA
ncbi:MAG: diguanylate cyclase [Rugosibacter sp.]|nr:diguanylate cyclase [Rugosibacter sp.]